MRRFLASRGSNPESDAGGTGAIGRKIWFYWAQGEEALPPLSQACLARLRSTNPQSEVVFLHDRNLADHITIPAYIYEKIFFNKTHFSDILRVSLLAKYGGVWIDATCYCREGLSPLIAAAGESGYFGYRRKDSDPYMFSSWFMVSRAGHIIPTLLRDVLYYYWSLDDALSNPTFPDWKNDPYFLMHFVFEALYNLDGEFRRSWESCADLKCYDAHNLQHKLLDPYQAGDWDRMMALSIVHKLTNRYGPLLAQSSGPTFLDHILSECKSKTSVSVS